VVVRLRTFLSGDAGVSIPLIDQLIAFLNADVAPAIPRAGFGTAGEIVSMAHAFGPLIGIGSVLDDRGRPVPATRATGGFAPILLGPKDGVALLQGVPGATALALLLSKRTQRLVDHMISIAALSILAVGATHDPYAAGTARADPELARVLARLRGYFLDSTSPARSLQAPVSFRIIGPALAHLLRAVATLDTAVDRALAGVTDSPAYLDGGFTGTAGFHGLDLAAGLDGLSTALVHVAEGAAARTHRLLDTRVTGLAPQLAVRAGVDSGLIAVHKRAVGVVHRLRGLTSSTVVGSMETSFGQEDVQTFSWEAAANAETVLTGAIEVASCELLVAYQAFSLCGRTAGPNLQTVLTRISEVIDPIVEDRPFGVDIEALRALLA
jgi:histidine ammonia-lyase